jgi:nitroreductase
MGMLMDVFEAIERRRSVRSYLPDPIPDGILRKVLEAGRLAPSASNRMPWRFIVVKDPKNRREIGDSGTYGRFISESPVVIVGCGDKSSSWHIVDTSIALQNMVLAATGEGIGTCWIGSFDEGKVKELLKIPDNFSVIALIAMGFPKEKLDLQRLMLKTVRKKKIEEIANSEEFDKPLSLAKADGSG